MESESWQERYARIDAILEENAKQIAANERQIAANERHIAAVLKMQDACYAALQRLIEGLQHSTGWTNGGDNPPN